jgi:hypothetical protein
VVGAGVGAEVGAGVGAGVEARVGAWLKSEWGAGARAGVRSSGWKRDRIRLAQELEQVGKGVGARVEQGF